jgi:hypothetical protein
MRNTNRHLFFGGAVVAVQDKPSILVRAAEKQI